MDHHERADRLMEEAEKLGCDTPTVSMIAEAIHDAEEEARSEMMFQLNILGMDDARKALYRWRKRERGEEEEPGFEQMFEGRFVSPPPRAKVGDVAENTKTGERSKVDVVHERLDGRVFAVLASGSQCVIPSSNWRIIPSENANVMAAPPEPK